MCRQIWFTHPCQLFFNHTKLRLLLSWSKVLNPLILTLTHWHQASDKTKHTAKPNISQPGCATSRLQPATTISSVDKKLSYRRVTARCVLSVVILPITTQLHTTHTFNGPFSGTTRVSRYQKGKTNLDFTEARDSEWQWHQVCTWLQTDNHASTPPLKFLQAGCPSCHPTNSVKALKD